jgi:hypothetical protein
LAFQYQKELPEKDLEMFQRTFRGLYGYSVIILICWFPSAVTDAYQYLGNSSIQNPQVLNFVNVMNCLMGLLSSIYFLVTNERIQQLAFGIFVSMNVSESSTNLEHYKSKNCGSVHSSIPPLPGVNSVGQLTAKNSSQWRFKVPQIEVQTSFQMKFKALQQAKQDMNANKYTKPEVQFTSPSSSPHNKTRRVQPVEEEGDVHTANARSKGGTQAKPQQVLCDNAVGKPADHQQQDGGVPIAAAGDAGNVSRDHASRDFGNIMRDSPTLVRQRDNGTANHAMFETYAARAQSNTAVDQLQLQGHSMAPSSAAPQSMVLNDGRSTQDFETGLGLIGSGSFEKIQACLDQEEPL